MRFKPWSVLIWFGVLSIGHLHADTHYVSKTGTNTFPYTSWATATDSVKLAIEAADDWDTVRVGSGTYVEDSIETKTGMVLLGAGHDSTTLEIAILDTIFTQFVLMGDSTVIEGFNLLGKSGDGAVSFRFGNAGAVKYNRIKGFYGGIHASLISFKDPQAMVEFIGNIIELAADPIEVSNGLAIIRDNRIYPPVSGRAIECGWARPIVEGNVIGGLPPGLTRERWQNFHGSSSDLLSLESITIEFCPDFIVRNNTVWGGSTGIWINNESTPNPALPWGVIENNTVWDVLRHGIGTSRNNVLVRNNIVAKAGQLASALVATLDSVRFEHNLIWDFDIPPDWDTALARNNIFVDPMFEDTIDFRLQASSPAIDAGDPAILDVDSSRSDIGAHGGPFGSSYPYLDLPPQRPHYLWIGSNEIWVELDWPPSNAADFNHFELYRNDQSFSTPDPALLLATLPGETHYVDTEQVPLYVYYRVRAVDAQGNASELSDEAFTVTAAVGDDPIVPGDFVLYPAYPNPFNAQTRIAYSLAQPGYVRLTVYNALGRRVRTLADRVHGAGEFSFVWEAGALASGVYFLVMNVNVETTGVSTYKSVQKALLLR